MMQQYPNLMAAFRLIAEDNAMPMRSQFNVPGKWVDKFAVAEQELALLTPNDLETLCMGEETEQRVVAERCPTADKVLLDAFDGDLNEVIYEW